jgi:mRNA interferase RelE/StbE
MKVIYKKSFAKDLGKIKSKDIRNNVKSVLFSLKDADNITDIKGVKKLKGYKTAFRIRIGDYRLGFFLENKTIIISRIIHRKDIYKKFP